MKLKRKSKMHYTNSYCKKNKKHIITSQFGVLEIITYYFQCTKCKKDFSVDDLKNKKDLLETNN